MGYRLWLSDKTVWKFAELPIYCQRQKCSPGNVVSGSIWFMQIFAGVHWRWGVKWVWSLKMAIFASFVHCLRIILHTWPHDSLYVMRVSMTLAIFQGHHIVSHQISQERCVIWQKLLETTNRKSYTSSDWCHFWWPWMIFEGHFTLPRPMSQKLYRIYMPYAFLHIVPQKLKLQ